MKPKCFFRGCDHKMKTSIAKRNFPSCSLHSQFTASQKLPLLFPNAKTYGISKWEPVTGNQHRKKKLPLLLTSFAQWLQIMLFMGVCLHFGSKDFLKHIVYQNLAFSR